MAETLLPSEAGPHGIPRTAWFPGGQRLAFFVLLTGILLLAYVTVRPVLVVLLLAAAVASLSFRLFRQVTDLLRGRARLSAAAMVLGITVLVLGPLVTLVVEGGRRIAGEIVQLVPRIDELQAWTMRTSYQLGPFGASVRGAASHLGASVAGVAPSLAQKVSEGAGTVGGAIVGTGIALFLFAVALYYFYLNGEPWRERFIRLLPIESRHARAFLGRFRQVSIAVLVGNLGTALIHGVLTGLGYWIFGVPGALLWAVATAIASFIPMIGTALIWVPLSLSLMVTHGSLRGLLLLGYCVVIVGAADNIGRPLLMEKRLGIHPLFVFVSVFGGLGTFGIAGLFLGPLVMALAVAALDIWEADNRAVRL